MSNKFLLTGVSLVMSMFLTSCMSSSGNDCIKGKRYMIDSYFAGTNAGNGYQTTAPYTVESFVNPYSGSEANGRLKVFVYCNGADNPRAVTMVRDQTK